MKPIYIYPGTFCPPHYGHVAIAKEAAALFGGLTVICSVNPVKEEKNLFTLEECKKMWQTYDLGPDIEVATLDEFLERDDGSLKIMVRGIRDDKDIKFENDVILYNRNHFGISALPLHSQPKRVRGIFLDPRAQCREKRRSRSPGAVG